MEGAPANAGGGWALNAYGFTAGGKERWSFCCQVLRNPAWPLDGSQDFKCEILALRYAARATSSEKLSLATIQFQPNNGGKPGENIVFRRSSILFRPRRSPPPAPRRWSVAAPRRVLVEPPGTAPGSDTLITRVIYRHSPLARAKWNIRLLGKELKSWPS